MQELDPDADEVRRALAEDWGEAGDVTTRAILADGPGPGVVADVLARKPSVVAGLAEASLAFALAGVKVEHRAREGARAVDGDVVAVATGPAAGVLSAERVALNYLMRMSGIATATRALQEDAIRVNPRCRVAATRKTTPLFRRAEKRAVAIGGGDPHRFGLFDAFLAKDNHRVLAGGDVAAIVAACRAFDPSKPVEVEVESLADALAAARAGAEWLLMDNVDPATFASWAAAVRAAVPGVLVEASGGITPANFAAYARHADRVSLGWLTHSAPAADFSLEIRAPSARAVPRA